jgi:O-antigen ligase
MGSYYFRGLPDRKIRMALALLMTGFFAHLLILTGRVGYVTFFLLSPLILKNIFKRLGPIKIILIYMLLLSAMFLSPSFRERLELSVVQLEYHLRADPNKAWGREYTDKQDRFYMWYGAIKIFMENPVFGVGTGAYKTALNERKRPEWPEHAHPHNNFLYLAVSFGIFGIIAFIWFFWDIFKNSWKERNTLLGFFVLSTALVIFVSGWFDLQLLDAGTAFLLAVATGLQSGFSKFSEEQGR